MTDLSTEIAAASPEDTREVLVRLWGRINPRPTSPSDIEDHEKRAWQFLAMLDCGAFLSAAEMLVPEGCLFGMGTQKTGLAVGALFDKSEKLHHEIEAATPALALAAAIAKSLEGREDR